MSVNKRWLQRFASWFESVLAAAGRIFVDSWAWVERSYRRPNARIALRLRFAFYPLLAVCALAWLGWDWTHARTLAAAEDAIFDQVISLRPWEPTPSGRVVVVEIDECSILHFRNQGEGGWPWSRQRYADLLDVLDRAGAHAVGIDILFVDPSQSDPASDSILESMAEAGEGRFVFAATRLHPDYDSGARLHASQSPSAFPLVESPQQDPPVAMLLPYGAEMRHHGALVNVSRESDGVLRDVPLREQVGDWAIPSLPLRLVAGSDPATLARYPHEIRINWRTKSRLPGVSAADLLEGKPVCRDPATPLPELRGRTVLVGYTAAGLNDAKPTPANATTPGVEVHAEAVEALLTGSAIWMAPAWVKYVLAAFLVLLMGYAFFQGEPAWELDEIFVATNLVMLLTVFVGLTAYGVFLDIFAAVGFVGLCFGLCRVYAATQRGYAIGNDDYRPGFDPKREPWLAMARLRFVPEPGLDPSALEHRLREFRRRLRRFIYSGTDAVAMDCVVEYDSWFWDSLIDVTILLWGGTDRDQVIADAERELDALHRHLAGDDDVLPDDGSIRVALVVSVAADEDECVSTGRIRVCQALGDVLRAEGERPLSARNAFNTPEG